MDTSGSVTKGCDDVPRPAASFLFYWYPGNGDYIMESTRERLLCGTNGFIYFSE